MNSKLIGIGVALIFVLGGVDAGTWEKKDESPDNFYEPASAVYDSEHHRILLFELGRYGGQIYAYDYSSDIWTQMNESPDNFYEPASAVYDPEHHRILLFELGRYGGQVYAYDYSSDIWTQIDAPPDNY